MLLGTRTTKQIFLRHLIVGSLAVFITYFFWASRPEWSSDMRFWRSVGDGSYVLLFIILILGPLSRLFQPMISLLSWRREIGIWFALLALLHSFLILSGWVQWDMLRFLGYEFIPQAERYIRLESGFGVANILGIIALFWSVILLVTSSDRAVNFLGISSWKWLHMGAYIIFYLTAVHVAYFMFMHYTVSFHRSVPPPNWFRFPSLILALSVFFLQMAAFIKTILSERQKDW